MIGISLYRVTRAALQNFWRNVWLSVATTVIMTLTLLMVMFLFFANIFGGEVLRTIEQKVDLSVTFKENIHEEYINAIAEELETREDISRVRIVTSEEALQAFRERHRNDPLIEESLEELENNPLPASIYIVAEEPRFYQAISKHLESEKYVPFIEKINFDSSRNVIDRLIALIDSIKNVAIVISITFALLVILITFNTVRLAIYSFREEIDIMRLVGASRWFIQGPFIIETVLVATAAVVLASVILYPLLNAITPHLQRFFFDANVDPFNLYQYAINNWVQVVGLQLAVAIGLAFVSSFIAIRRYLRD
jgi:cell division transport system permease protein